MLDNFYVGTRYAKGRAEGAPFEHMVRGSYARRLGVNRDLDVMAIVATVDAPFGRHGLKWDLGDLPVPAEILVYTIEEWRRLQTQSGSMASALANETVWVYIKRGES